MTYYIIYLACQYHIAELIAAAVFKNVLPSSLSPNIQLFKCLKDNWELADQDKQDASTVEVATGSTENVRQVVPSKEI